MGSPGARPGGYFAAKFGLLANIAHTKHFTNIDPNCEPTPKNERNIKKSQTLTDINTFSAGGIETSIPGTGETIDRIVQERYLCALLFAAFTYCPGGGIGRRASFRC